MVVLDAISIACRLVRGARAGTARTASNGYTVADTLRSRCVNFAKNWAHEETPNAEKECAEELYEVIRAERRRFAERVFEIFDDGIADAARYQAIHAAEADDA